MVYKKSLCDNVRRYFYSFVGYWERRADAIEEKYPGEDEKSVAARTAAYKLLCNEMAARERLRGVPSLKKWAKKMHVDPSTVSRWRKEHEEFDEACRDCTEVQDDILRDGGLGGLYSARVVTFLLEMSERRARESELGSSGMRFEDFDDEEDGGGA